MKIPRYLIFNFFTKAFIRQIGTYAFLNTRLKAIATDFLFILAIFFPFFLLLNVPVIILAANEYSLFESSKTVVGFGLIPFSAIIFTWINKDFYNARSVAKRIYGYQIVDIVTMQKANEMQCLIRNITLIIWPIEAILVLISPKRRLGDIIAKTKIIKTEQIESETILLEMKHYDNKKNNSKLILISIVFTLLFDFFSFGLTLFE